MNVIFLDIDGVLNNYGTQTRRWDGFTGVDTSNIKTLNKIFDIDYTYQEPLDIKFVMSSSWRTEDNFEATCNWLRQQGLKGEFIGRTPELSLKEAATVYGLRFSDPTNTSKVRSVEIQTWLKEHPEVESYVCIDDMRLYDLPSVRTDPMVGLTEDDLNKALEILNGGDFTVWRAGFR